MKISDLDIETKRVIFYTRVYMRRPTPEHMDKLIEAMTQWEHLHASEMVDNILRHVFGKNRDGETVQ